MKPISKQAILLTIVGALTLWYAYPSQMAKETTSGTTTTTRSTSETYIDKQFGFTFEHPSTFPIGIEERSDSHVYLEFVGESSSGLEAGEFIIVQRLASATTKETPFDYARYWRHASPNPIKVEKITASTTMVMGSIPWVLTKVDYSRGGGFIWYQTKKDNMIASFVLYPFDVKRHVMVQ